MRPLPPTPNIVEKDKTTFAEENAKLQHREFQIRQICVARNITTLVHFTRIENLRGILQENLLGRSFLETREQQFLSNDPKRLDGHKEANCLSISYPNYQLFFRFSRPDYSQWIVLLLKAEILWELDCAFCQENAASNAVRYTSLEERKKPDALKRMFVNVCHDTKGNTYRRSSQPIPSHYPTHPQAEVLVFDPIPEKIYQGNPFL